MQAELTTIRPEDLLAHLPWARSLATALVFEAHDREDLVQSTLLAALRRPPRAGVPLKPWLAKVMRNFARERVRTEERRRSREEARQRETVRAHEAPASDELAERIELQKLLAELLLELPEPLRATLILRYHEGLSAAEIARRSGVPSGTVRWRVKEGLDRLRERLDERHGGTRRAWMVLLAPLLSEEHLALGTAGGVSATTLGGVLAMLGTHGLGIGLAAAALLIVAFFSLREWQADPLDVEPAPAPMVEVPDPGPARSEAAAALLEEEPNSTRQPVEVTSAPEASGGFTVTTSVTARFVDETGTPLAGVRFAARVYEYSLEARSDGAGLATLESQFLRLPGLEMLRDPGSGSELDVREEDLARSHSITFTAIGSAYSSWRDELDISPGEAHDLGEVTLYPGAAISGRVVDARGRPVAGIEVVACDPGLRDDPEDDEQHGPPTGTRLLAERTDGDGGFELLGVTPGTCRVWTGDTTRKWTYTEPLELQAGELLPGIQLRVEPRELPEITIRVVDSEGEPVPRAVLWRHGSDGQRSWGSVGVDGEEKVQTRYIHGVFDELIALDPKGEHGYAILERPEMRAEIVLTLRNPISVEVEVIDQDGNPNREFHATIIDAEYEAHFSRSTPEDCADGRVSLAVLPRDFLVRVSAPGHDEVMAGPFNVVALDQPVRVILTKLPGVRGQVLVNGEPLPGASVELHGLPEPGGSHSYNDILCLFDPSSEAQDVTNEGGHFTLDAREAGRFILRVTSDEYPDHITEPFAIDPAKGHDGLVVEMSAGGRVEGQLAYDDGRSPARVVLGISRGGMDSRTTRTDREGHFVFENLAPGNWFVHSRERLLDPQSISWSPGPQLEPGWRHPQNCEIHAGETTELVLRLPAATRTRVSGMLQVEGVSTRGWKAELSPWRTDDPYAYVPEVEGRLKKDGRFDLTVLEPGTYDLYLRARNSSRGELWLSRELELLGEDVELSLSLEVAALRVTRSPEDRRTLYYVWRDLDQGLRYSKPLNFDDDGEYELDPVPAGPGRIVEYESWNVDQWEWPIVLEIETRPGETTSVELEK